MFDLLFTTLAPSIVDRILNRGDQVDVKELKTVVIEMAQEHVRMRTAIRRLTFFLCLTTLATIIALYVALAMWHHVSSLR